MTSHNHPGLPYGGQTVSSSGSHSFLRKLASFTRRPKSQPLAGSPSYTTAHAPLPTPPSSPPSSSSSASHRMALAAAQTASLKATANTGLPTPPSTARPLSRPRSAAPGTASSTLSTTSPAACSAPLVVQVEIRFPGLDGLRSTPSYTHEYGSSQDLQVSNRLCNGLLRRLTHCSTELITRRDSKALMQQLRHGHSATAKPLSYELHFRIIRKDSGVWAEKTFCSYQKKAMSSHDAYDVILATHRMVGLFLRRHDPAFRWSDAPATELTSLVPRPEAPELVSHTVGQPLPLSCIPRSRFLDDSQSFEFVPGYAIKLSFRSRCQARKQYEWKRAINLQSNQSAPLNLAHAEDLLWQTFESLNSALSARRQAFSDEHKACDFLEGVVSCQHFDEDALDIELKIQNNLGPNYTHLTRSIHSKLALFRHVDGLDCQEFIRNVHSRLVQSRETADLHASALPDFDYRITALHTPSSSLENPARFVLDASTSYSRRSIEAILDRVETGIFDVLRHKGCTIHVVAYKRGHLILDKSIVTHSHHAKPALFPKAPVHEDAAEIVANLKERIHQDINAVCKDTCSLDSLDNIGDLRESAVEARAANLVQHKQSSFTPSPPMTPASATVDKFDSTIVLEEFSDIDDAPVVPAPRVVELPGNVYLGGSRPSSPAASFSNSTRRRAFPLVPEKFILPHSSQPSPPSTPPAAKEVGFHVPVDAPLQAPVEEPLYFPAEAPAESPAEVPIEAPADPLEARSENATYPSEPTILELAEMLAETLADIVRDMETPGPSESSIMAVETPEIPIEARAAIPEAVVDVAETIQTKDDVTAADVQVDALIEDSAEAPETLLEIPAVVPVEEIVMDTPIATNQITHLEEMQHELKAPVEIQEILAEAPADVPETMADDPVEIPEPLTGAPAAVPQTQAGNSTNTSMSSIDVLVGISETLVEALIAEQPEEAHGAEKFLGEAAGEEIAEELISTHAPQDSSPVATRAISAEETTADENEEEEPERELVAEVASEPLLEDTAISGVLATEAEEELSEACHESILEENTVEDTTSEYNNSDLTSFQSAESYQPQALLSFDDDSESESSEQMQEEVGAAPFDAEPFFYNFDDEELAPVDLRLDGEESPFDGTQLDTIFELEEDETSSELDFEFPVYDQGMPNVPSVVHSQDIAAPQEILQDESSGNIEQAVAVSDELVEAEFVSQPVSDQHDIMNEEAEDFDGSEYSDDEPLMFSSPTRKSHANPFSETACMPTPDSSDLTRPSTPSLSHGSGVFNSPEASFLETPKIAHDSYPTMIVCYSDNDTHYDHPYDADGEASRDRKPEANTPGSPVVLGESLLEMPLTAPISPTVCEVAESDSTPTEVWREADQSATDIEVTNILSRPESDFHVSTPAFSLELDAPFEDFAMTKPDVDMDESFDPAIDELDSEQYHSASYVMDDAMEEVNVHGFQLPEYDGTAQSEQEANPDTSSLFDATLAMMHDASGLAPEEMAEPMVHPESIPLPESDDSILEETNDDNLHLKGATEVSPCPLNADMAAPVIGFEPASEAQYIQSETYDTLPSYDLADEFPYKRVDELTLSEGGAPSEDAAVTVDKLADTEVPTRCGLALTDPEAGMSDDECTTDLLGEEPIHDVDLKTLAPAVAVMELPCEDEAANDQLPVTGDSGSYHLTNDVQGCKHAAELLSGQASVLPTPPESEDGMYTPDYVVATLPRFATKDNTTTQHHNTAELPELVAEATHTTEDISVLLPEEDLELGPDTLDIPSSPVVDLSTADKLPVAVRPVNVLALAPAARHPVSWLLPKAGLVGLDESRLVRVGIRSALTGSRVFDNICAGDLGPRMQDTQLEIDDDIDLLSADEDLEEVMPPKHKKPVVPEHAEESLPEPTLTPTRDVAELPLAATATKVKEEPTSNHDVVLPRVIMAFASMAVMAQMLNRSSS